MEEMVSSDALEKEILEDARKKGERLLKDAETEQARLRAEHDRHLRSSLESLEADFAARAERHRGENHARLPLEKGRMKASFVDRLLAASAASYLSGLSPERATDLVSAMVGKASGLLGGLSLELRCKGLSPEAAQDLVRKVAPGALIASSLVDESLPAFGLLIKGEGGRVTVRATIDLVGESLLDRSRGELAQALCAEALAL